MSSKEYMRLWLETYVENNKRVEREIVHNCSAVGMAERAIEQALLDNFDACHALIQPGEDYVDMQLRLRRWKKILKAMRQQDLIDDAVVIYHLNHPPREKQ